MSLIKLTFIVVFNSQIWHHKTALKHAKIPMSFPEWGLEGPSQFSCRWSDAEAQMLRYLSWRF